MILNTRRSRILMCKEPTDMRLGYDGLHKLAKKVFGQSPYHGQSFVFVNRRRTSCKVYIYDGSGDVLICKRLSQGVFCKPNPFYKKQIRMTGSEFSQFFEGLNVSGRILESTPYSKPTKKGLRFIPPYRRLSSYGAGGGIQTGTNQTSERTQ
jgi:transposase